MIRGKDFHNFHWTRRITSKRGHGKLGKKQNYLLFFLEKRRMSVRKKLVVMCEEILFMEVNGVQIKKYERKLCVTSSYNGIHGMISMNKLLDFLL